MTLPHTLLFYTTSMNVKCFYFVLNSMFYTTGLFFNDDVLLFNTMLLFLSHVTCNVSLTSSTAAHTCMYCYSCISKPIKSYEIAPYSLLSLSLYYSFLNKVGPSNIIPTVHTKNIIICGIFYNAGRAQCILSID